MKKKEKNRKKNYIYIYIYKLRSSFILRKNRQEHRPKKFKTQKHLSVIHINTKLNTNKSKIKPLTLRVCLGSTYFAEIENFLLKE